MLRGLKRHVGGDLSALTAVVTVSDDGGSSGRLRREFGVLPPGDIRNCIAALADDEHLLAQLFQYRFANGEGLSGHSFGNLFLTALTGITGDFYQAILTAEDILSVRGRILPSTLQDVRLRAVGVSGRSYDGESAVGLASEAIASLELDPPAPPSFPAAVAAIESADIVVLGPGSLYTSILPNLLIPDIRRAVEATAGRVVLVLNLMTQPGETDGMGARAHLEAIERHVGPGVLDAVLVNSTVPPEAHLGPYREEGSEPVVQDEAPFRERGIEVFARDLLADDELVRHDPAKVSRGVLEIARG